MNSPPRRARFQIHLSTAIVLMFVAGGLMWANALERTVVIFITQSGSRHRGWPFTFVADKIYYWGKEPKPATFPSDTYFKIFYEGLILDLVFAVVVLAAVWFVLEWLIRRRARK